MHADRYGNPSRLEYFSKSSRKSGHKGLEIEITKIWGMKIKTILFDIEDLGVVKKGIESHIDKVLHNFKTSPYYDQAISPEKYCLSNEEHDYPLGLMLQDRYV